MNASYEHPAIPAAPAPANAPATAAPSPPPEPAVATSPAPLPATPPPPARGQAGPGAAPHGRQRLQHKSPALACLLSGMPGVGQIYVGYYKLGFIHNIVFGSTIALLASGTFDALTPGLGIFLAFFFIYNVVDAGRRETLYNLAVDGVEGIDLPSMNVSLPGFGGSLGGGAALMALGAILLSNTLFGLSLDWIESWWPVAPIVVGAWLFVKALRERRSAAPGVEEDPGETDASGDQSDQSA